MANISLAAKYRPQTFAEVVGQDTVKKVLSLAALQDKVAPAYLLSGTRGVGKTTIARIFAKALNCKNAPTGEPCNECEACRRITQGAFVDVIEIDGASNRGIDDVRKLRESVGYSPIEGRYKVIIIDEAHMLTKEAFNALLKTLEEPPSGVVFILATTEPHKFPVTILSRCQLYVFKQVPEQNIEQHLAKVLKNEQIAYEDDALSLIARRAMGSVRDAMSLLGQCLALSPNDIEGFKLESRIVRQTLGLAGIEVMDRLLQAMRNQDVAKTTMLVRDILAEGIDIGFFLGELVRLLRSLFVLKEAGKDVLADLPLREVVRLEEQASYFSAAYLHAGWQMVLENQRRILQSYEPASALELLLLNLTLLPRLLPLENVILPEKNEGSPNTSKLGE